MKAHARSVGHIRYTYAYGFRSYEAAEWSVEDSYANGDVSPAERPLVYAYVTKSGAKRFGVTLLANP